MSADTVIRVENLSKYYRLGLIGGGTLREDLNRWWALKRGKPDPLLRIGEVDHGNRKGGHIWALKDISLEVKEGEILGIIGRNGAGKSTLLKILSRITAPTSGRALIKGRVGSLLEVGTGFHPELTGRENIYLNGTILGMSRAEVTRRLEQIVDFAELVQFIDTPVKRYSSGMSVRLAFAVAAHLEPEILVIDEVLAVGDIGFQKKCLSKMNSVAHDGRTVLFVTHNMVSIRKLCTRGVLIRGGSIISNGDIRTVVEEYEMGLLENCVEVQEPFVMNKKSKPECETTDLKIEEISIRKEGGDRAKAVRTWDNIELWLRVHAKHPIDDAGVDLEVFTTAGTKVFSVASHLISKKPLHLEAGAHLIKIAIDQIPLAGGQFIVGLAIAKAGSHYYFKHRQIGYLNILGADIYGSGYALRTETSPVIVNARVRSRSC